jgi:hypothetical protein
MCFPIKSLGKHVPHRKCVAFEGCIIVQTIRLVTVLKRSESKPSLLNLSVEEQNLASIPFAVLERRVGKTVGKLELNGTKLLPDGTEVRVVWQIQGNNELGLPTEQDLDIFVALGVLTFQNNFQKTISFTGREIAKILNSNVHGKFYQRLKMAMDRFIPLRFRAIMTTDRQEQVKWLNVFQEASFTLDRSTGRCVGTVTWTDKLIRSMDSGFFRLLDAGRYMELDGITAKHMYRYLAVAFEKTDLIVIDARTLAQQNLGILNLPKYFSRLLQTLEPAFDQLIRLQVLASYHVVSGEEWKIALHRHPSYVPATQTLMLESPAGAPELQRQQIAKLLEKAGFTGKLIAAVLPETPGQQHFCAVQRAVRLLDALKEYEVLPHVAMSLVRRALEANAADGEGRDLLDTIEMAIELCRHKRETGQKLRNAAGFLVSIVKDEAVKRRMFSMEQEAAAKARFRHREVNVLRQEQQAEERVLILEYDTFRQELAKQVWNDLSEDKRKNLFKQKFDLLKEQERFKRLPEDVRQQEVEEIILQDLARSEAPPFDRWHMRYRAQQAVLPFATQ